MMITTIDSKNYPCYGSSVFNVVVGDQYYFFDACSITAIIEDELELDLPLFAGFIINDKVSFHGAEDVQIPLHDEEEAYDEIGWI